MRQDCKYRKFVCRDHFLPVPYQAQDWLQQFVRNCYAQTYCVIAQLSRLDIVLVKATSIAVSLAWWWRLYARLNRCAGIILFVCEGIRFHRLETLTLKKFLLSFSLPFLTFTFRPSAATLVTLALSLTRSNQLSCCRLPMPCMRHMLAWSRRSSSDSRLSSVGLASYSRLRLSNTFFKHH